MGKNEGVGNGKGEISQPYWLVDTLLCAESVLCAGNSWSGSVFIEPDAQTMCVPYKQGCIKHPLTEPSATSSISGQLFRFTKRRARFMCHNVVS